MQINTCHDTKIGRSVFNKLYCDGINPHPPKVFFVTRPQSNVGLLQPLPWIFYTEGLIPLYLLPEYRYGPLLSIDTKMSTIKLHDVTMMS